MISVLPEELVRRTFCHDAAPSPCNRHWIRMRTALPVLDENSAIPVPRVGMQLFLASGTTALAPSGVMIVLPGLMVNTPSRLKNLATSLADRRSAPGAVLSRRRTATLLPVHFWNASIRPSAVQDSGSPSGLKLPTHPVPGQVHSRCDPVARLMTPIFGSRGAFAGPEPAKAMASLLPSGDSAMPASCAARGLSGSGSAVSCVTRPDGPSRSRKNLTRVSLSRCSAARPPFPLVIRHHRWAARTNVRSSAAPSPR